MFVKVLHMWICICIKDIVENDERPILNWMVKSVLMVTPIYLSSSIYHLCAGHFMNIISSSHNSVARNISISSMVIKDKKAKVQFLRL